MAKKFSLVVDENELNKVGEDEPSNFIKQALTYTYFGLKEELRDGNISEERATIIKASIDDYKKIKMKLEGKEDE